MDQGNGPGVQVQTMICRLPELAELAELAELDRDAARLGGGQTTAIILSVTSTGVVGAAVGDSRIDLTSGQCW